MTYLSILSSLPILLLLTLSTHFFPVPSAAATQFNVDTFGAKGDGATDSTDAFIKAWNKVCGEGADAIMYIPNREYAVQPMVLQGNCRCPRPTIKIDGTVSGPTNRTLIARRGYLIKIYKVSNLVIQGGVIRGRADYLMCKSTGSNKRECPTSGRMLRISNSNNVLIDHLTSYNSSGFHLHIENSRNVNIVGATIVAPENSPNTDGIHLQRSVGVTITGCSIKTGDDCISIGPGSQNVWIQNIQCGPGHGISVGSLGSSSNETGVQNVTVKDVHFSRTTNGFRIKTRGTSAPLITVKDIHFLNAIMSDVNNPIIIDQNYCPNSKCPFQPSSVSISDVEYGEINGTSRTEVAINFNCSSRFHCTGLKLHNIMLKHSPQVAQSKLVNADVHASGYVEPKVI